MPVIHLRRDFFRFYLLLTLGFCVYIFLSVATGLFFLHILKTGTFAFKDYLLLPFSLLTLFMAFFTLVRYISRTPSIAVEGDTIRFGKKRYFLNDIEQVYIIGKVRFPYIIDHRVLGGTLVFKNGDKHTFYQELYSNGWLLKYFLEQVILRKQSYTEPGSVNNYRHELIEPGVEFKDSPFTSARSLFTWFYSLMFLYCLLKDPGNASWSFWLFRLFMLSFLFALFAMNVATVYFFEVTDEFFIVRNHIFFWKKHIYKLNEIDRLIFETRHKLPDGLRVISKDYRTKLYWACTLNRKTWLAMKQLLDEKGVRVKNESIPEHGPFEKLDV